MSFYKCSSGARGKVKMPEKRKFFGWNGCVKILKELKRH